MEVPSKDKTWNVTAVTEIPYDPGAVLGLVPLSAVILINRVQCGAIITQSSFFKILQTIHSSPVRVSYGVFSVSSKSNLCSVWVIARIILCMRPANERRRYNVTSSLIGWAHAQNDPCCCVISCHVELCYHWTCTCGNICCSCSSCITVNN